MRSFLQAFVRNGLSLVGTAIATAMAALFVALALLDLAGYLTNPYLGLLLFVAIPTVFVAGLLLIPLGLWRERRRRARTPEAATGEWPVFDLRIARQRAIAVAVLTLTVVNLVIVSMAAYGGVHYMETREFCGQVCHETMEPQYVAHQTGPHSRVACVSCHVGSGAGAVARSKFKGLRQLVLVATDRAPRPVAPPLQVMRPAVETCEQCHWPEKFHGDRQKVVREYGDDQASTETGTTLTLHLGGGSAVLGIGTGIHWHMNLDNVVEFVATDSTRQSIPYVRLTNREGRVKEYVAEGADRTTLAAQPMHRMDCVDCHNRPAHAFSPSPARAVNEAMAQGRVPRDLPFARREVLAAVSDGYPSRDSARAGIARRLEGIYRAQGISADRTARLVAGAQDVYARNVFPAMRVSWGTYPNNIGHMDAPGCFRCHDDSHKAGDGSVLTQDCETCHTAPQ
ncbi:MAG: cytochrome c3 family protein [Vicinamibacterales bacterium]